MEVEHCNEVADKPQDVLPCRAISQHVYEVLGVEHVAQHSDRFSLSAVTVSIWMFGKRASQPLESLDDRRVLGHSHECVVDRVGLIAT